jgi:transcription antitermination factor NusG
MEQAVPAWTSVEEGAGEPAPARWYVLWTRSHCEQLVHDQLVTKGFTPFLPTLEVWSRRAGVRRRVRVPMFAGYLFLHDALDRYRDVEVRKARGLVTILGEGWDRRAVVPSPDMDAIRRVVSARLPVRAHPYLKKGQRVRITRGPMADVEGVLLRINDNKGVVVLSVDLLQRSVAVEIDCTATVPI